MKRLLITLLCIAMMLSLCACATPTVETSAPTPEATPEPAPSPTSVQTPTPEPTLSPEEIEKIKILDEVKTLFRYYEQYEDYYALYLLKELFEAEKITRDEYTEEMEADLNEFPPEVFSSCSYYSALLNGRMEEIDEDSFGWFLDALVSEASIGYLHLSFFDHQEQRDRVEAGVKIVDRWIEDPSDENTKAFEELILSDELTDEEKVFLIRWLAGRTKYSDISRNGQIYSSSSYVSDVIIDEDNNNNFLRIMGNVQDALFIRNNTPNSEKE